MTEENQLPATHQDSSEFAVVLSVTAQLLSDSGLIFFFPPLENVRGTADPLVLPNSGHSLPFTSLCHAGRRLVQLSHFHVLPVGAAAASAVTQSFPRRYKMKLE